MRNAQGYAIWQGEGKPIERDTITCCHCNAIEFVDPPPAPMKTGFCRMCMDHLCQKCADNGVCTPFERRLEQMESRDRLFKSVF